MTTSRADRFSRLSPGPPFIGRATGSLANCRTLARPLEIRVSLTTGSKAGRGPSTSNPSSSVFHQLFDELQRGLRRHLKPPYIAGDLGGLGVGVAERERGRGQDQRLATGPAELGQPTFHVGVEALPGGQRGVAGEDRVRRRGGEVAALVGVAGLEDHRASLRERGTLNCPAMSRTRPYGGSPPGPPCSGNGLSPCRPGSRHRARSPTARSRWPGRSSHAHSGRSRPGNRRGGSSPRSKASQEVTAFQAARPPDRWSRLANCRATS